MRFNRCQRQAEEKAVICLMMALILVLIFPMSVLGDTGYDETAPTMSSFKILNSKKIDIRKGKNITMEINLQEEGTGVTHIFVDFCNAKGDSFGAEFYSKDQKKAPLFSGKKKVLLTAKNYTKNVKPGIYQVRSISIMDANENERSYSCYDSFGIWKKSTKLINVKRSGYTEKKDKTPPVLNKVSIHNASNVDGTKGLTVDFSVKETGSGMDRIGIGYETYSSDDSYIVEEIKCKKGSTKNMTYDVGQASLGKSKIIEIVLYDKAGNISCYNASTKKWKKFKTAFTVTNVAKAPVLKSCKLLNREITTPDLLEMDIEMDGDNRGAEVMLTLSDAQGKERYLDGNQILKKGRQQIGFSISPFFGNGTWKIEGVKLIGMSGKVTNYVIKDKVCPLESVLDQNSNEITVSSSYKISYYGSTRNYKTAAKKISDMKEGQTAVLDCRYGKTAKKNLFLAIAGKNKTLVFEDEDIQWIFNGKNIKKSRCKDINFKTKIKRVKGETYGYAEDPYILYMKYADNGTLPGKVEMRVNYKYLCGKYEVSEQDCQKNTDENLLLSYYDKGKAKVLKAKVEVAEDKYVEYHVTHNSTYLLSRNNPKLPAPSRLKACLYRNRGISLSWGRVGGAYGYKIYRSTSSNGCYKQIAFLKGNKSTSFTDKKVKKGKKYFYRVKANGASKKTKGAYSKKVSCSIKKKK